MGAANKKRKSSIFRDNLLILAARRNVNAALAHLTRRLGNSHDAEDVLQSSFTAIVGTSDDGVVDSPFACFSTVVERELEKFGAARDQDREHQVPGGINVGKTAVRNGSGGDPSEALDRQQQIEAALAELSPRRRLALYLFEHVGLSYKQIARQMSISPDAVKKILHRARKQLKRRLPAVKARP
jgi:RNA polymerase sigma-70 factor, ECF subfamily